MKLKVKFNVIQPPHVQILLKNKRNLPVLTNLNETLLCVLSASLKLGCTKSFSAPPLDEAILLALELNPRHANTRLLDFVDSGNIKSMEKLDFFKNIIKATHLLFSMHNSQFSKRTCYFLIINRLEAQAKIMKFTRPHNFNSQEIHRCISIAFQ